MRLQAPAKVNLFLEVLGRRPDGFHEVLTLLAKIDLSDSLWMAPASPGGDSFRLVDRSPAPVPGGPVNLVLKAVEAFRREFGEGPAWSIRLEKRIPAGGGLGGGSSDAAAALLGLARLGGVAPGARPLARVAGGLGADVPFFLLPSPLAAARGIGDRLTPLRAGRPFWVAVVYPGEGVSTQAAYKALDRARPRRGGFLTSRSNFDKLSSEIRAGAPPSIWTRFLFNRFEETVFRTCPAALKARRILEGLGGKALLSGSGSCVFAPAQDEAAARRLAAGARRLGGPGWKTYAARLWG